MGETCQGMCLERRLLAVCMTGTPSPGVFQSEIAVRRVAGNV